MKLADLSPFDALLFPSNDNPSPLDQSSTHPAPSGSTADKRRRLSWQSARNELSIDDKSAIASTNASENGLDAPKQNKLVCTWVGCKSTTAFSRQADLSRHIKTHHTSTVFKCPVARCDRAIRPFPRKDKRDEHVRKCHGAEASASSMSSTSTTSTTSSESLGGSTEVSDTVWADLEGAKPTDERSPNEFRRFACPYYKRSPTKYKFSRSCAGPGWADISRIKEHLYRRHTLPPRCERCYTTFENDFALRQHTQNLVPCKIQPKDRKSVV